MLFRLRFLPAILGLVACLSGCVQRPVLDAPADLATLPEFNRLVLEVAAGYPQDGTHGYWWPKAGESDYDGCSADVHLGGERVMDGEPGGRTYCCGFTLEVFVRALERYRAAHDSSALAEVNAETFSDFQRAWFVEEVYGPGPSLALERVGAGRTISPEQAMAGDFVQLWRRHDPEEKKNGSGHSVIFLRWARDNRGNIIGMEYFSTQPGTDGIGFNIEYFGGPGDTEGIAAEHTHYGRVDPAAG